jgi:hypothetical protein
MAAKRTHQLIPLCHPLPITKIAVDIEPDHRLPGFVVQATVKVTGKTGVEMEALTAVSVACLTIYDMVKAVERGMRIEGIRLLEKQGGKSGPTPLPAFSTGRSRCRARTRRCSKPTAGCWPRTWLRCVPSRPRTFPPWMDSPSAPPMSRARRRRSCWWAKLRLGIRSGARSGLVRPPASSPAGWCRPAPIRS